MIVLPQGAGPDPLPAYLAERSWLPRPGPAFVMTAEIADLPASTADVRFSPEPDAAFLGLYRYRGQDLPPIAWTLMMSAPWQAFGTICRDGRTVACGRISVAGDLGVLTAVEVDRACRRQGLGAAITSGLAAAAAGRGARRILLQVETGNAPARALYQRCGFRDSHRYEYMIAP
jgi:ribosomal protein S18 acetylase RimI-like enzyme